MRHRLAVFLLSGAIASVSAQAQNQKKSAQPAPAATSTENTPIITIGQTSVPVREFRYVYNKNNSNAEDAYTDKSVREYVELYSNFKLKVMEAERLKMDTNASFKSELEGYRKQLAQPYLTEKSVSDKLVREAYDRMKEEVRASHILIMVDPQAAPKDTLAAFNKVNSLRDRAMKGEDFGKLARENSEDPSAKTNGGDLGYFSSMQMVYPFESAAFNTATGQLSKPVRTRFGYHLVKVTGRRASQGQVTVAHIMIKANPGMPTEDSTEAVRKINEIYGRLQKGEKFESLATVYSEDQGSREKGGALPAFTTGSMIPSFEEYSFALKDTGNISKPFQTPYGWHIVKLLNRKPLETYEELEPTLKTRVQRDSRSELNRTALLARLRKENNVKEFPKVKEKAMAKADTSMLSGKWQYKRADKKTNDLVLFSINGENHKVGEFLEYVEKSQTANKKSNPQYLMGLAYTSYLDDQILKYEDKHLADKYEDYRMLYKEYRDGILLFSLMDKEVWTKAIEDTAGLKAFYEKNKQNYRWDTRADAVIYNVSNKKALDEVKMKAKARRFLSSDQAETITFNNNAFELTSTERTNVRRVALTLMNDTSLSAEVRGLADAGEKSGMSRKRAKIIVDSLIREGVPAGKIKLIDGGAAKKGTKAGENRKAVVSYYSSSLKTLEREMNQKDPLAVQITEGKFQKEDNPVLGKLTWRVGDYTIMDDPTGKGRITYVDIKSIEQPRAKTLDEARGLVISDYQNELERQWVASLRAKNPVKVNEDEVKKIVKK